ncbi:YcaO-like family protein [Kutzneria sp. CA-103260]|uniref:YcaO-like family protein n=1 Tax=Kutzneria sp. CA-103260 TaxID=2802641 RepID=UPI001BADFFF0|nr:YcaO-like family protein [Kutzneria sp. CA-103260]QUQ68704.1 YcaO cyclodehydratase, ATP-ad Mg2+-binding [Kutzneria sp. CA-103260]
MKPQLARDAYFAPVPDGVYWLTNKGPVTLTGKTIAAWIDRLAPFLDGQRSLDDLVAHLPADRGAFVSDVVRTLHERGLVKDVATRGLPPDQVLAPHAAEVHFIDDFADTAVLRFVRYRNCPTVVIGAGRSLVACAAAGPRSGMDNVTVMVTDDCATDLDELRGVLGSSRSRRRGVERLVVGEPEPGRFEQMIAGATVVVHVSDRVSLARTRVLTRICHQSGTRLLQVVMTGAEAWIDPLPSMGRGDWDDARLRLSLPEQEDDTEPPTPDAAAVLADHVVHRVFQEVTGLADTDDVRPRLARFDLRTLRTTYHRVLPHPFAGSARPQTADEFRHNVNRLSRGPRLDEETFSRRAAELVDDRLGPFRAIGERDFAQLPLHVSEVTVADPVCLPGERRALIPVIAAGPDFAAARHRAAVRAFAVHGSLFVDPRRLLAAAGSEEPKGGGDPADPLVALTSGALRGRVWGTRLTDGEPCEVPVETVFPALRSAGATAGYDWAEAVTAGVAGRCLDLTVAELAGDRPPLSVVDIRYVLLDEIGQRYRQLLAVFDTPVVVYDATGSLGVPTFAFCLGAETVAYASAPRVTDALRDGLEQVLLACQARMHSQHAYAPPPVPQLPPRLRGDEPARQRPDTGLRNMVEALCSNGRIPVAVPLDHDPEMSQVMPYAVQVVLR